VAAGDLREREREQEQEREQQQEEAEEAVRGLCGQRRLGYGPRLAWGALAAWAQTRPRRTSGGRLALYHGCVNAAGLHASAGCSGAQWSSGVRQQ
jgi:hypothetical protein